MSRACRGGAILCLPIVERMYDGSMVQHAESWNEQYQRNVQVEINPMLCPNGHQVFQRPGWHGCVSGGHRSYVCSTCWTGHDDPGLSLPAWRLTRHLCDPGHCTRTPCAA